MTESLCPKAIMTATSTFSKEEKKKKNRDLKPQLFQSVSLSRHHMTTVDINFEMVENLDDFLLLARLERGMLFVFVFGFLRNIILAGFFVGSSSSSVFIREEQKV